MTAVVTSKVFRYSTREPEFDFSANQRPSSAASCAGSSSPISLPSSSTVAGRRPPSRWSCRETFGSGRISVPSASAYSFQASLMIPTLGDAVGDQRAALVGGPERGDPVRAVQRVERTLEPGGLVRGQREQRLPLAHLVSGLRVQVDARCVPHRVLLASTTRTQPPGG